MCGNHIKTELVLRKGDFIDGIKILGFWPDPFIKGQTNIVLDDEKINEFGDRSLQMIRVKHEKQDKPTDQVSHGKRGSFSRES